MQGTGPGGRVSCKACGRPIPPGLQIFYLQGRAYCSSACLETQDLERFTRGLFRVVAVDDEPASLKEIEEALMGSLRGQVLADFFDDPVRARESILRTDYHLGIFDVIMPTYTGNKLAEDLRRRNRDSKIIYLSSAIDEVVDKIGFAYAGHFLKKPLDREQFVAVVKHLKGIWEISRAI